MKKKRYWLRGVLLGLSTAIVLELMIYWVLTDDLPGNHKAETVLAYIFQNIDLFLVYLLFLWAIFGVFFSLIDAVWGKIKGKNVDAH